jgi:hypothetical protein
MIKLTKNEVYLSKCIPAHNILVTAESLANDDNAHVTLTSARIGKLT